MSKLSDSSDTNNRLQWIGMALVALVAVVAVWWFMSGDTDREDPGERVSTPAPVATSSASSSVPQPVAEPFSPPGDPVVASSQETGQVLEVSEEPPEQQDDTSLTLAGSDEVIREDFSEIQPNLLTLLAQEHMVRKFVRAVNALDNDELVNQYRPFAEPSQPFKAQKTGESEWRISEDNFARYTPYVNALDTLGAERLVELYEQYRPLIDEAFLELGTDKTDFEPVLKGALTQFLDTPEPSQELALERPSVFYRYQDEELEKLPESQKLLLRMGPDNRQKIKRLAREIMEQL